MKQQVLTDNVTMEMPWKSLPLVVSLTDATMQPSTHCVLSTSPCTEDANENQTEQPLACAEFMFQNSCTEALFLTFGPGNYIKSLVSIFMVHMPDINNSSMAKYHQAEVFVLLCILHIA